MKPKLYFLALGGVVVGRPCVLHMLVNGDGEPAAWHAAVGCLTRLKRLREEHVDRAATCLDQVRATASAANV